MTTTTCDEMMVTGNFITECAFGYAPSGETTIRVSDVAAWGLRSQWGRGGTFVVAKMADGRIVEVPRSKQSPEAAKFLRAATKGLRVSRAANVGRASTFAWRQG